MIRRLFACLSGTMILYMLWLTPQAAAELTCSINGEEVTFEIAYWDDRLSSSGPVGVIQGTDVEQKIRLSITVEGYFSITTYSFTPEVASPNRVTLLNGSSGILFESRSGSLTVTSKTDRLSGNFAITLAGHNDAGEEIIIEMTDGVFDLSGEPSSTTSTIPSHQCPAELLYGADSGEVHLLRMFRDAVLNGTPEGREMVRLYYHWSEPLVALMREDRDVREAVRKVVESVVPMPPYAGGPTR